MNYLAITAKGKKIFENKKQREKLSYYEQSIFEWIYPNTLIPMYMILWLCKCQQNDIDYFLEKRYGIQILIDQSMFNKIIKLQILK